MGKPVSLLALAALLSAVCSVSAQPVSIQREMETRLSQKSVPTGFWSVSVRDEDGVEIASLNSEKLMVPASNMKLITSAAILEELGPDFKFTTPIYGEGELRGRTWYGNLHIVGSGDPSINGNHYDDDTLYVFKQFAAQLKAAGIDSVSGMVFGNTAIFDGERLPADWDWYDLPFYYAAEVGPLAFNSNTVFLTVDTRGKIGSTPGIRWFPFDTDYVQFVNNQKITARGTSYREYYRRYPGNNTITLGSRLPQGYVETEALTVSNPTLYFLDSFVKFLSQDGFHMDVRIYEDPFPRNWNDRSMKLLAEHESEPLSVLLQKLNKDSDNLYAEMFLKTLAHHYTGGMGSVSSGEIAANHYFSAMGLDTLQISFRDGSGLASTNLVSTGFISGLLHQMSKKNYFPAYDASMTIAGVDGTFKNRLRGTALEGNLRGKSGSIARVRAFSGYLTAKSGKRVTFSMITNNFRVSSSSIDRVHESLALFLYEAL